MFREYGTYESKGEKFYYIETGVIVPSVKKVGKYVAGDGDVLYYKTQADYESSNGTNEPFRFEWNTDTDRIEIYECEYDKDIDLEELLNNLKENILPLLEE
jgi:hypothetical protein